jgi:hypothetical protein
MLRDVNHWLQIAGTAVDALLLARILLLRLHRTYLFITLACVLAVFFDGVELWLGAESREFGRVFVYSRFLYAFVYPVAAADVWEEVKGQLSRLRRVGIIRLSSSLLLATIFGLIVSSFASSDDNGDVLVTTFAVVLWAASSAASLAFLWSMRRVTIAQKIELPHNTSVWLTFWGLSLLGEVIACFLVIIVPLFRASIMDALDLLLNCYGILIALWCVWRLRGISSSKLPTAPESASL